MAWQRIIIALLPWVSACIESPTPPKIVRDVALGEEFELAPGESARVSKELTTTFERVAADSRCPVDVVCVWEGDATVVVRVRRSSKEDAALELHTSKGLGSEARYEGYRVRLVELAPQPQSSVSIPQGKYRGRFVITSMALPKS